MAARKKPTTRKSAGAKASKAKAAVDETTRDAEESPGVDAATDAASDAGDATPEVSETPDPAPAEAARDADNALDDESAAEPDATDADDQGTDADPASAQAAEGPFHPPAPTADDTSGRGGFGGLVLGGIVAAGIGAVAAYVLLPQLGIGATDHSAALTQLEAQLQDQTGRVDELTARIAATETGPDLSGIEGGLSDVQAQIAALADRIAELEARPVTSGTGGGTDSADVAELRAALAAQQAQVEALMANAAQAEANAQASATGTLRRAALTRIRTALDSGAGFATALADLEATGQSVPDALSQVAADGVPTLAALQSSFPESARAALAAARAADPDASAGSGMLGFLNNTLGVRSLEPREGDDPDAILSRAEAALRDGRLTDALAEVETLPETARTELSDWAGQATKRLTAVNAAETLGAELE